ncbi:MAG: phosphatidylserine/phosphatidylglycerophosphate/cardiolipin synthase family protein [Myxococcales bacterium]|nr:phosphatidylserine/phosphatidylglycerophosphate/cardiolipin synthase family protein [Myxococcales bacterium]
MTKYSPLARRVDVPSTLTTDYLSTLSAQDETALLSYLNLPPLGAFDDQAGPPALGSDAAYEIEAQTRLPLLARREALGGRFASLDDLRDLANVSDAQIATIVERLGDLSRYGHSLRPVWGGPESLHALIELLENAERYIHISMYIIGGEIGMRVARILAEKRKAGVEVRVMFTASGFVISGSPSGTGLVSKLSFARQQVSDRYLRARIVQHMLDNDVEVVDTAPLARHWKRQSFRERGIRDAASYYRWCRAEGLRESWIAEQEALDRVITRGMPYVDHRKMVVVDGKRALIGSMNIADSYFYENELAEDPRVNVKRWQWHDNAAILEGGAIAELNHHFACRWSLSGGGTFDPDDALYQPPNERRGEAIVTQVASVPGLLEMPMRRNWSRLLLSMLGADRRPLVEGSHPIRDRIIQLPELAQQQLHVEHCYPSDAGLLERWSERLSKIPEFVMVVPKHYDTVLMGLECDRFFPDMQAAGARLYGFNQAIVHSKIAVADSFYVATGSYNLTVRSARMDLELQFFVQDSTFGNAVRERICGDLARCVPIEPTAIDRFRSRRSIPLLDALIRFFLF